MTMTEGTPGVDALRAARAAVLARIDAACHRVGRDPSEVTLVAVSKTVPVERLRDAVAAGLTVLGENRVQEGAAKVTDVPGATWHLVGPLQSNKARRAMEVFDVVESVDSVALAVRLDRIAGEVRPGRRYPILVQVNVDLDPAKSGFRPAEIDEAMGELLALRNLAVDGLMTVGRLTTSQDEARATFRELRALSTRLRGQRPALGAALSMGMTDDFEVAVEEGATIVRVGRALFGERPHEHGEGEPIHTH
jgi:pyridoxal phosphate enzyme (YggS family)